MRIEQLPAIVTKSGIRTGSQVTDDKGQTSVVGIYAKPCSPYCFELTYKSFEGRFWRLTLNDALPVDIDFDLQDVFAIGALARYITDHGKEYK